MSLRLEIMPFYRPCNLAEYVPSHHHLSYRSLCLIVEILISRAKGCIGVYNGQLTCQPVSRFTHLSPPLIYQISSPRHPYTQPQIRHPPSLMNDVCSIPFFPLLQLIPAPSFHRLYNVYFSNLLPSDLATIDVGCDCLSGLVRGD